MQALKCRLGRIRLLFFLPHNTLFHRVPVGACTALQELVHAHSGSIATPSQPIPCAIPNLTAMPVSSTALPPRWTVPWARATALPPVRVLLREWRRHRPRLSFTDHYGLRRQAPYPPPKGSRPVPKLRTRRGLGQCQSRRTSGHVAAAVTSGGKAGAWGGAGGVALAVAKRLEGGWGQTTAVGTNPPTSPNAKRTGPPIHPQPLILRDLCDVHAGDFIPLFERDLHLHQMIPQRLDGLADPQQKCPEVRRDPGVVGDGAGGGGGAPACERRVRAPLRRGAAPGSRGPPDATRPARPESATPAVGCGGRARLQSHNSQNRKGSSVTMPRAPFAVIDEVPWINYGEA